MSDNVRPDSRLKTPKATVMHEGVEWEPVFCPNCGKTMGFVSMVSSACMPCRACSIDHVAEFNALEPPETVFWKKVQEAVGRIVGNSSAPALRAQLARLG